jgi:hypothetical protein
MGTVMQSGLARDDTSGALLVTADGAPEFNVKAARFGAKGDGTTDDTAAIQAAANAITAGGTVLIPHGTYKLTSALTFNNDDVTVVGERGTKLVLAAGANSNVLRFNTTADTSTFGVVRRRRVALRSLFIDMQGASQGNTGGIDGCIVAPGVSYFEATDVYVKNSKNTAFEVRGTSVARFTNCTVDSVFFGNAGNGFNVGQTGSVPGTDVEFVNCHAIGVQDIAFWLAGSGGHRMTATGCTVRSDVTKYLSDGVATSGSGVFTSATAAFTSKDVGKTITIAGAGPAGASLTCRIFSFNSATSINLSVLASTSVPVAAFSFGADEAPARQIADAAITTGTNVLTSATAAFSTDDVQKGVLVMGASASGGDLRCRITGFTNSTTVTLELNAGTTVSGATAIINATNGGILAEGANGNSDHVAIVGCHVVGTVNVGMGGSDSNTGVVGSKHDQFSILGGSISDSYGTAMWFTGTQFSQSGLVIDNAHRGGILLGDGNEFAEGTFTIEGGSVKMAADATGNGLTIRKDGGLTNTLSNVTVIGLILDGNGGGSRGVSLEGKLRTVHLIGVQAKRFKSSGLFTIAKNGASPQDVQVLGGDYRNNNQAANAAGANSVGINIDSATDNVTIIGAQATDDQAGKTQTHGLRWAAGATRGRITDCDFRGNLSGPSATSFDSLSVYKDNKDVDAAYEGTATLVAGTVTVNTAAARNSGASNWGLIELSVLTPGGTQGALFISAIVTGTSFTIKSTSATDTSVVKWRIT